MRTLEQVLTPYIVENLMLKEQRDELLAACKAILRYDISERTTERGYLDAMRLVKDAINSVEGNHEN